jgi:hypothetical protein
MAIKKTARGRKSLPGGPPSLRFELRFSDPEHYDLVRRAFEKSKLPSMNGWLVLATLSEARFQLGDSK